MLVQGPGSLRWVPPFLQGKLPEAFHSALDVFGSKKVAVGSVEVRCNGRKPKFTDPFANVLGVPDEAPHFVDYNDAASGAFGLD